MGKDLLTVGTLNRDDLNNILSLAKELKETRGNEKEKPLAGKTLGLIFSKTSTRTRLSFEVGIRELGGSALFMDQSKTQMGHSESVADTAKVMSRYLHGVIIRTYSHGEVEEFAENATMPVINALTDDFHPCQVLTDLFTIYEYTHNFKGVKMAFLGDGASNMANSMILAAKLAGIDLVIAAPEAYAPSAELMKEALPHVENDSKITWEKDPIKAIQDVDFIYTDVWVSMGDEDEREERLTTLAPYQVNSDLMKHARKDVKVLHCLPAHREEEITSEVLDSESSIVFDQAENRLHVQKAILHILFTQNN
jgi:ornithine carbamoyltransferase